MAKKAEVAEVDKQKHLLGPAFERGYGEQRQHCTANIIKVKVIVLPSSFVHERFFQIFLFVIDEHSPSRSMKEKKRERERVELVRV
jgi:hypothetical protein